MCMDKIQNVVKKICDGTVTEEEIKNSGIMELQSDSEWQAVLGDFTTAYERYFSLDTIKKMVARFNAGEISLEGFHTWSAYYEGAIDPLSELQPANAHEKEFCLQDLLKHVTANVFFMFYFVPWARNDPDFKEVCDKLTVAHYLYQNLDGWQAICWMQDPTDPVVWLLCYHEGKKKYCRLDCSFVDLNPEMDEDGYLLIAPYKICVDKVENKEALDTKEVQLEGDGYSKLTAEEIESQ